MMDRMSVKWLLVMLLALIESVISSGIITHIEIARRAHYHLSQNASLSYYNDILNKHPSYFEAGAPWPDGGYAFGFEYAAEYTHWPPFIEAFIDHIKATYAPDSRRFHQLVAFTFGIASHSISDVLWHLGKSLPRASKNQGFIDSFKDGSNYCFHSDEDCHGVADAGGDLYVAYRGHVKRSKLVWNVPINDIALVYEKKGYQVNKLYMRGAAILLSLGSFLGKEYSWFVFQQNDRKSPFIPENLDTYYHGGIDDLAIHTNWEWLNVIQMLEKNKTAEDNAADWLLDIGMLHPHISNLSKRRFLQSLNQSMHAKRDMRISERKISELLKMPGVECNSLSNGDIEIAIAKEVIDQHKEKIRKQLLELSDELNRSSTSASPSQEEEEGELNKKNYNVSYSNIPFSYFGTSFAMGDFAAKGTKQKVIGAYGYGSIMSGAVYLLNPIDDIKAVNFSDPTLTGAEYSKFGFKVAVVDLNHDGIDDLVVSAPTDGLNHPGKTMEYPQSSFYFKDYSGKVFVYLGRKGIGIEKNQPADYVIKFNVTEENVYDNFGLFLEGRDCDGDGFKDLLIGSPYASSGGNKIGSAAVFTGLPPKTSNETEVIYLEQAAFFKKGGTRSDQFGASMTCADNKVIVGAPGHSYERNSYQYQYLLAAGIVYGYDLHNSSQLFEIESNHSNSRFGLSLALGGSLLAVGAPSDQSQADNSTYYEGSVYLYDINSLNATVDLTKARSIINGGYSRERLGKSLQFILSNTALLIGAPHYSSTLTFEKGSVYLFKDISSLPSSTLISSKNATKAYSSPISQPARFGSSIFLDESDSNVFYVSAPFTLNEDNSGALLQALIE